MTQEPATGICPHLGTIEDNETHFAFPSDSNHCYRRRPSQPVDRKHQARYCLRGLGETCPAHLGADTAGERREEALPVKPAWTWDNRRRTIAAVSAAALILAFAGLWASVAGNGGESVPGPTEMATPGSTDLAGMNDLMTSAASSAVALSPPTSIPTSTKTPTATDTPQPTATRTPAGPPTATPGPGLETPVCEMFPFVIHEVKFGETMSHLARVHDTTSAAIQAANGLTSATWRSSVLYVIPAGVKDASSLPAFEVHRVPAGGERLDEIASAYETHPAAIQLYNDLGADPVLPEGRWLIIPKVQQ